jgi:L-amino acid N-acyltransferase YncA
MPPCSIRPATPADLAAINAIYNHYVLHATCTYQTEPTTAEERAAWFAAHGPLHPVTIAELDAAIAGWGRSRPTTAAPPTGTRSRARCTSTPIF